MKDLSVLNIYEQNNNDNIDEFFNNLDSNINFNVNSKDTVLDVEWIEKIEDTIQYLDNIFRNPNRFIINEEDIVKIELARKITVESIKHLSKNTNLIQDYNKETGDVRPSKILNINKEESYDTYENRLIYTLIQNMKVFISKKKSYIENLTNIEKNENKVLEYSAKTEFLGENVNIKLELDSAFDATDGLKSEYEEISKRIQNLERKITDITNSEVYKILDKKHFALVTPPIKKTNVILKNVNFQYAIKLWDYLQNNLENKIAQSNENKDMSNDENLINLLNETFLLNYLITTKYGSQTSKNNTSDELTREELTNLLVEKLIALNSDLTQEEILKMIGIKYNLAVEKTSINLNDIKDIFEKHIDKYFERIND